MSLNLAAEFQHFDTANDKYYLKSHGQMILNYLIVEALDNKGLLEEFDPQDQNKLKIFSDNRFILGLMQNFSIPQKQSPQRFLKFLSYIYLLNKQNVCKDIILDIQEYLNDSDSIEKHIQQKGQIKNGQQNQQIKQQSQELNGLQQQRENIISNNNSTFFEKISTQQSITAKLSEPLNKLVMDQYNLIHQKQNQKPQVLTNQLVQQHLQNKNNLPVNQNLVQQQKQYQPVVQSRQVNPNQVLDQLHKSKIEVFQEFVNQAEKITDGISYLAQLQQKYGFLEFNYEYTIFNGTQFRCSCESKSLMIQKVFSKVCSKKKDSQHDAAKKFLPHILYYLTYKKPYIEDDDEELEYIEKKNKSFNNIVVEDNSTSIEQEIKDDLMLQLSYKDEIQGVTLLVQQHEKNFLQEVLKCQDEQEYSYYKCTVIFQKENRVFFTSQGYGSSKKNAKQVAFMKINPLIQKYYNPDIQILPQQQQQNLSRNIPRNTQFHLERFNYQADTSEQFDY